MKKLILLLLFLPLTYATLEGSIYTQEELSGYDLSGWSFMQYVTALECQMEMSGNWSYRLGQWIYYKEFSCLQMDVYNKTDNPLETHYILTRKSYYPYVAEWEYNNCMDEDGATQQMCGNRMLSLINVQRPFWLVNGIWNEILKYQIIPTEPDDLSLGGDIW